jgi:hypothetical protein
MSLYVRSDGETLDIPSCLPDDPNQVFLDSVSINSYAQAALVDFILMGSWLKALGLPYVDRHCILRTCKLGWPPV